MDTITVILEGPGGEFTRESFRVKDARNNVAVTDGFYKIIHKWIISAGVTIRIESDPT